MELKDLRHEIDGVDRELIALLEGRMDISQKIAALKKAAGTAILDPAREKEKLDSVKKQCRPETAELIASVFEAVMAASRAYQKQITERDHG